MCSAGISSVHSERHHMSARRMQLLARLCFGNMLPVDLPVKKLTGLVLSLTVIVTHTAKALLFTKHVKC